MAAMIELDDEQQAARDWFEALRDRICAEFEAIEREGRQRRRASTTRPGTAPTRTARRAAAACAA